MTKQNREQKATDQPEEWSLHKAVIEFRDSGPKFSLSPNFGKQKPWIVRAAEWVGFTIYNFFFDVFTASKSIIKEIM